MFGWRVCRNLLPTRCNLNHRGLKIDVACPVCHCAAETMLHCFRDCKVAEKVWKKGRCRLEVAGAEALLSFRDELLAGNLNSASALLFGMWCLWYNRNQVSAGKSSRSATDIINSVALLREEWKQTEQDSRKLARRLVVNWSPPRSNTFKVNFDGALIKAQKEAGVGVVVRDGSGFVLAALAAKEQELVDPLFVEALAAFRAVSFAFDMGFRDFWLEGDSQAIIKALSSSETNFSPIGHIIEATKSMLASVSNLKISHVRREGNKAAHGLAAYALSLSDQRIWLEAIPYCISAVVAADMQLAL